MTPHHSTPSEWLAAANNGAALRDSPPLEVNGLMREFSLR
jgi:hypothetical protein